MSVAKTTRKCPYCKEVIAADAVRCKVCHADLSKPEAKKSRIKALDTFRTGFLAGVAFTLVVLALAYLHFTGH